MSLFQESVLKNYLKQQDNALVEKAYKKYVKYFHNSAIQQNIKDSKEEQFQEGFLRELFVNIFDYVLNPNPDFNLTTEYKNQKGAKKADGAILKDGDALAVIELKGTKTKDLESIRQQAFDYKANQTGCVYVITSNFEKLRFYINNAVDFEEFNLFTLNRERFALMYLCLHKENLLNKLALKINNDSLVEEEKITKKFYADYSLFKRELYRDLVKQNMKNEVFREELSKEDNEQANKNIKLSLFKKSQKLIDRFLFIFFAEDRGLLPPNSTLKVLEQWDTLRELDEDIPLYKRYLKYFNYLDTGRKGTDKVSEIFAYNGGLFKPDPVLDSLKIDDELLYKHTKALSGYDFESQVDVNILGHIFENSLNEIESVNAEIEGTEFDKQKTKRKKDGVFYTPKYITKYIVDNTVGKLCTEKKAELEIKEEDYFKSRKGRPVKTLKALQEKLKIYRDWMLTLTILDPACGSGAFLNQALDFLIKEHRYIDELQASLLGGSIVFQNIGSTILENNIYGVDLNEESVEIAKLSLWLRTAQPRRQLNVLSNNIKCGNSLIDDPKVAGNKAFNWYKEFPDVFRKKDKKAWHVTFCLYASRAANIRMEGYGTEGYRAEGLTPQLGAHHRGAGYIAPTYPELSEKEQEMIAEELAKATKEYDLNIVEVNVCNDHVHAIMVCEEEELSTLVGKWKGRSAYTYNRRVNPSVDDKKALYADGTKEKFWAKSFHPVMIENEEQLQNTINYIKNNRKKHQLPAATDGLTRQLDNMRCTKQHAFSPEYNGGFDVVIGNPPYLRVQGLRENFEKESVYFEKKFDSATGRFDIYVLFMEMSYQIIHNKGTVSFILPHKFLVSDFGEGIRKFFVRHKAVASLVHFGSEMVFADASTYTCIINLSYNNTHIKFKHTTPNNLFEQLDFDLTKYETLTQDRWNLKDQNTEKLFEKLNSQPWTVKDVFANISQGVVSVGDDIFLMKGKLQADKFIGFSEKTMKSVVLEADIVKPLLKGEDVKKYSPLHNNYFCLYPHYEKDGKTVPYDEDYFKTNYPLAFYYILPFKNELIEKKIRYKTNPTAWYSLHRSREIRLFKQEKIITPETSLGGNMTIDNEKHFHNTQVYSLIKGIEILEDYKFWIAILNSSLFWFYLKSTGAVLRGGYFRFKTKYLEPFPLPRIETIELQNPLVERVDFILSKTKSFVNGKNKFITYFESNNQLETISKKLQNWHELDFSDFINELNKAIKKAGSQKLTKSDEMEWMDVFETKKAEAQALKAEIDKTDKEIDQMVYELYGLTEEEIRIVEESIK